MLNIGIMQGRLTIPNGRGIQFFPFENWEREFDIGREIGINEIEWIFDYPDYEKNPIWSKNGTEKIKSKITETGILVNTVCFDYFMRRPFYKENSVDRQSIRNENIKIVRTVLKNMQLINARLLEIPMVDGSSVGLSEEEMAKDFISEVIEIAKPYNIKIGIESDYSPSRFKRFLTDIGGARANYDSGNSSGLGYNHVEEITSYGEFIENVHIKDRVFQGTTVKLGTGSANFDDVFSSLKKSCYSGSIILQAARDKDGDEKNNIENQIKFVKAYLQKYELE